MRGGSGGDGKWLQQMRDEIHRLMAQPPPTAAAAATSPPPPRADAFSATVDGARAISPPL